MSERDSVSPDKRRIEVNWVQSLAGAFAAVTSAVLLSTVGVAGTLIGAAVGSVVATVGSAVYSYYIRETKERVAVARTVAAARVSHAQARLQHTAHGPGARAPGATQAISAAGEDLKNARAALDDAESGPSRFDWRTALRGLPWKRITMLAGAIFVVAMLVILTFELITGRAVSSYTGGSDSHQRTSIPGLGGGGPARPEPSTVPTSTPSQDATTPSPGDSSSTPSETPTTTPSSSPTQVPTLPDESPSGGPSAPAPSTTPTPQPSAPAATPTPAQ